MENNADIYTKGILFLRKKSWKRGLRYKSGRDAVREEPLSRLTWIPIAYDCARAWLVVDLTPAEGGTVGQVTALDYDTDQCWLLADSLDGLFGKMTDWLQQGMRTGLQHCVVWRI